MEINDAATNAYPNLEKFDFEMFIFEKTITSALRQAFKKGAEWQERQSPWKSSKEQPRPYSYILIFHDQMGTGYKPVFVDKEFLEKWNTLNYVLAWMYIPEPDVD